MTIDLEKLLERAKKIPGKNGINARTDVYEFGEGGGLPHIDLVKREVEKAERRTLVVRTARKIFDRIRSC